LVVNVVGELDVVPGLAGAVPEEPLEPELELKVGNGSAGTVLE
jgi:hypothetical protein